MDIYEIVIQDFVIQIFVVKLINKIVMKDFERSVLSGNNMINSVYATTKI